MPGNRCSNCIAYSFECTYVEAAKVCPTFYPVDLLAPILLLETWSSKRVGSLSGLASAC